MTEMASLWGYEENHDMEQLGQKLLFTTLELEKIKAEAMEEMRKNNEYVKQLIQLLKHAIQERDEARNQLHKLLNKTLSLTTNAQNLSTIPMIQADSHLLKPGKANSSITESNSLSETYNYHSHGSSPVESLFDAVSSSPDFSNINLVVQESNPMTMPKVDQGSLIIDNLVKGKALPEKGKFLQAVIQAGPLLQTLLLAGPLPRWRNPPQFQPFQIPPVSIKACESDIFPQKPALNVGQLASRSLNNSQPYAHMSCGSSVQVQSAPMLNFANLASGTCLNNDSLISSAMNANGYAPLAKRQRFS